MTRPYAGWSTSSMYRLLLTPDAAGTAAGGTTTVETPPAEKPPAGDSGAGYKAALAKHDGDAAAMARTVYADNERLRGDLAAANAKAPATGSVVLAGDDAAAWGQFKALGSFAEVKAKLDAGDAAATAVKGFERGKSIDAAARAHGYDADVLAQLAGPDLVIEVKDGTRNGKPAKVAEVVTVAKGADGKEAETRVALDKHAEKAWGKFLPSLKVAAPAASQGGPARNPRRPQPATGEAGSGGRTAPARRFGI